MADSTTSQSTYTAPLITEISIPPSLKFFMNNFKTMVTTPLTPENYYLWSSQILKLFKAVNLEGFLHGTTISPPQQVFDPSGIPSPNPQYQQWLLIDQHLSAALNSTISAPILPYILHLETTAAIWQTLLTRLQSSNRSRIKTLVDQIAAAGATVDNEDIILYILNDLPSSYQPFKSAIRTRPGPLSLDELYALLITEEITIAGEASREIQSSPIALYSTPTPQRGRQSWTSRGRGRQSHFSGRRSDSQHSPPPQCQICSKFGHKASDCWYRYSPSTKSSARPAFIADNKTASQEWVLDTGATSHLTHNYNQLHQAEPYHGSSTVVVGNGSTLPISNSGDGILPTPTGSSLPGATNGTVL